MNGLKSGVIHVTKIPHLIELIWHTLAQNYFIFLIHVQTVIVAFVDNPFMPL